MIFMHIVSQKDDIDRIFRQIVRFFRHFYHSLGLGLGIRVRDRVIVDFGDI